MTVHFHNINKQLFVYYLYNESVLYHYKVIKITLNLFIKMFIQIISSTDGK